MKLKVTDVDFSQRIPLNEYSKLVDNLCGIYEIKGKSMGDRENQLWDLIQYNSKYKLAYLTFEKLKGDF
mgnify:CR=1 FL=1|tara:strand:+ start:3375 stop:3581 length:207 start_codon:yes stop_codon:yes gene_type:complete